MVKQTYERIRNRDESGFTLIEILATIAILGILIAISVPVYLNHQKSVAETEVKANLLQAAILIDQEKIDNNGLYPKYMPNEILSNPKMKAFAYTYGDNRLIYCLQGTTPAGKSFFVSSFNKQPTTDACTQKNVAAGSTNPGNTVVVPSVTVNTASNTWGSRDPAAVATLAVSPVTCTSGTVSYMIRVTDTSTGQVVTSDWQTDPSIAALTLTGFYPDDNLNYDARARCSITGLNYVGNYGGAKTDTVAKFTVAKTAFTSGSTKYTWSSGSSAPQYTAAWAAGYCPIGTANYSLTVLPYPSDQSQGPVARYNVDTTANTTDYGSLPADLANYGGNRADLSLQVNCVVNASKTYSSDYTTYSDVLPVGAPAASTLNTPTINNKTNLNGSGAIATLTWSAVTCKSGSTVRYSLRSAPYGTSNVYAEYGSTITSANVSLDYNTAYSFKIVTYCSNSSNTNSAESAGNVVSFNTGAPLMSTPTWYVPTSPTPTSSTYIQIKWGAPVGVAVSSINVYELRWGPGTGGSASSYGGVNSVNTSTSYGTVATIGTGAGRVYTFYVTAKDSAGNIIAQSQVVSAVPTKATQ